MFVGCASTGGTVSSVSNPISSSAMEAKAANAERRSRNFNERPRRSISQAEGRAIKANMSRNPFIR